MCLTDVYVPLRHMCLNAGQVNKLELQLAEEKSRASTAERSMRSLGSKVAALEEGIEESEALKERAEQEAAETKEEVDRLQNALEEATEDCAKAAKVEGKRQKQVLPLGICQMCAWA